MRDVLETCVMYAVIGATCAFFLVLLGAIVFPILSASGVI